MIAIIDYGVGNLFSLHSSLSAIGAEAVVTRDIHEIQAADRIILPGVGAFGDAVSKLRESGMFPVVLDQAHSGKPFLGICVGMQLLFDCSLEFGTHEGLGLIPGSVEDIRAHWPEGISLDLPHMGWNPIHFTEKGLSSPLFREIPQDSFLYFVHSFAAFDCEDSVIATTEYGTGITAAVQKDNLFATQFHPEKSGDVGLRILKNFAALS